MVGRGEKEEPSYLEPLPEILCFEICDMKTVGELATGKYGKGRITTLRYFQSVMVT